jgi:uncharacterized protein YyaL (SSP411 family)
MRLPEGGFRASLDADSEREEGRYSVWSPAELDAAIGDDPVSIVRISGDAEPTRALAARAARAYAPGHHVFVAPTDSRPGLTPSGQTGLVGVRCVGQQCGAIVTEPDAVEALVTGG